MTPNPYRPLIESALVYASGTHTYEDVVEACEKGEAQYWAGPNSIIITQIDHQPQKTILQFWLAAGNQKELEAMEPHIIEWGKEQGCTTARFLGRKGWERSFLAREGWTNTGYIIMERSL
jgi:hypothetical protein